MSFGIGAKMQFLRTVFWVVVAVLGVIFAFANWTTVELRVLSMIVAVNLPLLLLIVFLIGLVPPLILHRATRWSFRRKLEAAQRNLALPDDPPARAEIVPPGGTPIAPPPGVA